MAFAATNVKTRSVAGGLKMTTGDWTGTVGDSTGTVTVAGGPILGFQFWSNTVPNANCECTEAAGSATNTRTITVGNIRTVTDGHFWILHL